MLANQMLLSSAALLLGRAAASPLNPKYQTLTSRSVPIGVPITSCTVPGTIALTFDDGPYIYTAKVLDLLKQANMAGTFFVNGPSYNPIEDNTAEVQRMLAEGHQLASHTWSHPRLTDLSAAAMRTEMTLMEETLMRMIGKYPTYMRPPYLAWNDEVLATLGSLGYHVISSDLDTRDWENVTPETWPNAVANFRRLLDAGGSITLMHDVHPTTVDNVLPAIIAIVRERGLRAVTVGECLGDPKENWYTTAPGSTPALPPPPAQPPTQPPVLGPDGACGRAEQYQCPTGQCCSQYNYCGVTSEYCAAGCQPLFGRCD